MAGNFIGDHNTPDWIECDTCYYSILETEIENISYSYSYYTAEVELK